MAYIAFLFPGQGSQRVGMGRDLIEAFPDVAQPYFDAADRTLGFSLTRLCLEGPEEELIRTENQQPGIFLVSCATLAVLQAHGVQAEACAGHSLGEYSALVAADALPFEDGLRLTRRRGELMAAVGERSGGIMAAVLGLDAERVRDACQEASAQGVVEVANYNSPQQTVISGEEAPVKRAMDLVKEMGARRTVLLPVSAPFHCSLMRPLAEEFSPALDAAPFTDARIPVVANVTADVERDSAEVRRNLVSQLDGPVRWTESIQRLVADGVHTFVEVGPGKVLTGLMRQIAPEATALHTGDAGAVRETLERLTP